MKILVYVYTPDRVPIGEHWIKARKAHDGTVSVEGLVPKRIRKAGEYYEVGWITFVAPDDPNVCWFDLKGIAAGTAARRQRQVRATPKL